MSTCVPTPVSTAFSTVTGENIITTYSLSTSTAPPVVTTRVEPFCENEAVVLDSTVCFKSGTRTSTETIQRTFPLLMLILPTSSRISRVALLSFVQTLCILIIDASPTFYCDPICSSAMSAFNCRHEHMLGPIPTTTPKFIPSISHAHDCVTARPDAYSLL